MTTVIAPLSLNRDTPYATRITPGDFEGSATKPAPPRDHIPLRRRCAFPAVAGAKEAAPARGQPGPFYGVYADGAGDRHGDLM
jgi:hypothetical protein